MPAIIVDGREIAVPFNVNHSLYQKFSGIKPQRRPVLGGVIHHDVTLSPGVTFAVLKRRGLSSHFCVDDDGTVFQYLDPGADRAVHCKGFNDHYLGIDINNPCLLDYMDREDLPAPDDHRPLVGVHVNGSLIELLGFFEAQIFATAQLVDVLSTVLNIPRVIPHRLRYCPQVKPGYRGWLYHMHVDPHKIDPCTFPLHRLQLEDYRP